MTAAGDSSGGAEDNQAKSPSQHWLTGTYLVERDGFFSERIDRVCVETHEGVVSFPFRWVTESLRRSTFEDLYWWYEAALPAHWLQAQVHLIDLVQKDAELCGLVVSLANNIWMAVSDGFVVCLLDLRHGRRGRHAQYAVVVLCGLVKSAHMCSFCKASVWQTLLTPLTI